MGKAFQYSILMFIAFSTAISSHAAEGLKLKPAGAIYVDGMGKGISLPEGVSCRDNSRLVVADTGNGRLLTYTIMEGNISPGLTLTLDQLPYPIRVESNSKGEIFSLDGKLRKIVRINSAGEFLGYLDVSGLPSPETIVPKSFKIDHNDNIYILDIFSKNVIVLNPGGQLQREISFSDTVDFFSDLAIDAKGNIFLIDSIGKRVYSAATNAETVSPVTEDLKEYLNFPTSISLDPYGRIFVVDQHGSGIVILGIDGSFQGRQLSMGWNEGFLRYPSQLCINNQGSIFIADRGNNRVQIFTIIQK